MAKNGSYAFQLIDRIKELEQENEKLKEQIENMRNCGNCTHSYMSYASYRDCGIHNVKENGTFCIGGICDEYEWDKGDVWFRKIRERKE